MTCNGCSNPTDVDYCDPCHVARLRGLLKSRAWRALAETRTGDRPGETLLDSIRRELAALS